MAALGGNKVSHLPSPKRPCPKSKSHFSLMETASSEGSSALSPTSACSPGHVIESRELSLGQRVLVGGAKEGILRFMGRVHFMEGDWCGVELDEAEGLHDGVVEQVRYFMCRSGHGIFAPLIKVTLAPDQKSANLQSQNYCKRTGTDTTSHSQPKHSEYFADVDVSVPIMDAICKSPVSPVLHNKRQKSSRLAERKTTLSLDVEPKESSKLPRPKSAVVPSQIAQLLVESPCLRRSSLVDFSHLSNERHQGITSKRVTFDDTLEYHLSSSYRPYMLNNHPDHQSEGYASDDGSYCSAKQRGSVDPYTALTLTYGLESIRREKKSKHDLRMEELERPVEKLTTYANSIQPKSIQIVPEGEMVNTGAASLAESDGWRKAATKCLLLDSFEKMEEEISNLSTPDTADIQMVFPDGMTSSEEDTRRMFSGESSKSSSLLKRQDTIHPECSANDNFCANNALLRSNEGKPEAKAEIFWSDKSRGDFSGRNGEASGLVEEYQARPTVQMAAAMNSGEIQAVTKTPSFALARTALAQYADLIRAAHEEMNLRMTKTSAKPRPSELNTKESSDGISGGFMVGSKPKNEAEEERMIVDADRSDSIDSLNFESSNSHSGLDEYEMFEGEDLHSIRSANALTGSEDGIGIESEEIPLSNRLALGSGLLFLNLSDSININASRLPITGAAEDFSRCDGMQPTAMFLPDVKQASDEDLLNVINCLKQSSADVAVAPCPVLLREKHVRPVSMMSTASSDAGIGEDMVIGFGTKYERPISLISSASSADTGCPMEIDSEIMGSMIFSSTLDELVESWQEETGPCATGSAGFSEPCEPSDQPKVELPPFCPDQLEIDAVFQNGKSFSNGCVVGLVENNEMVDGNDHEQKQPESRNQKETNCDNDGNKKVERCTQQEQQTECTNSSLPRSSSDRDGQGLEFGKDCQKVVTDAYHQKDSACDEEKLAVVDIQTNTGLRQTVVDGKLQELNKIDDDDDVVGDDNKLLTSSDVTGSDVTNAGEQNFKSRHDIDAMKDDSYDNTAAERNVSSTLASISTQVKAEASKCESTPGDKCDDLGLICQAGFGVQEKSGGFKSSKKDPGTDGKCSFDEISEFLNQKEISTEVKLSEQSAIASDVQKVRNDFRTEDRLLTYDRKLAETGQDEIGCRDFEIVGKGELIFMKTTSVMHDNARINGTKENVHTASSDDSADSKIPPISEFLNTRTVCVVGNGTKTEDLDTDCNGTSHNVMSGRRNILKKMTESGTQELEQEFETDVAKDRMLNQATTITAINEGNLMPDMAEINEDKSVCTIPDLQAVDSKLKGQVTTGSSKSGYINSSGEAEATTDRTKAKVTDKSDILESRPSLEVGDPMVSKDNFSEKETKSEKSPQKSSHVLTEQQQPINTSGIKKGIAKQNGSYTSIVKSDDKTMLVKDGGKTVRSSDPKSTTLSTTTSQQKTSSVARHVSSSRIATRKPPSGQQSNSQASVATSEFLGDLTRENTKPNSNFDPDVETAKTKDVEKQMGRRFSYVKDSIPSIGKKNAAKSNLFTQIPKSSGGKIGVRSSPSSSVPPIVTGSGISPKVIGGKSFPARQVMELSATKSSKRNSPSAESAAKTKQKNELNPQLMNQLEEIRAQLKQTQKQLDEMLKERESLHALMINLKEEQAVEIKGLRTKHQQEIGSLKKTFVERTKMEIDRIVNQHSKEVKTLKSYHERHLSETKHGQNLSKETQEKEHQDVISELKAKHLEEINEIKASHEQQLNEISERFEEIKISLSIKVEQLRNKCDEMCSRELCYKDTCKRETELRQQAALEVDSLKVVVEQKSEEVTKLCERNATLEVKVKEIPDLKELIVELQQKIENLEAVNNIKTDHEKQLAEMHQVLLRKFERESKAMKRLSMENEELIWRLSQSDIGPSCLQDKLPTGDNCGSSLMSRSYDGHHSVPHEIPINSSSQDAMSLMSKSYDGSSIVPVPSTATVTELPSLPSNKATVPQIPRIKPKRSGHSK